MSALPANLLLSNQSKLGDIYSPRHATTQRTTPRALACVTRACFGFMCASEIGRILHCGLRFELEPFNVGRRRRRRRNRLRGHLRYKQRVIIVQFDSTVNFQSSAL